MMHVDIVGLGGENIFSSESINTSLSVGELRALIPRGDYGLNYELLRDEHTLQDSEKVAAADEPSSTHVVLTLVAGDPPGVYQQEQKTTVEIEDYDCENNMRKCDNTTLSYLVVTKEGPAFLFTKCIKWYSDRECTSGYDAGNTGRGYDIEAKSRTSIEAKEVRLQEFDLSKFELLPDGVTKELKVPARCVGILGPLLSESGTVPSTCVGTWTRRIDKTVSGEDYNEDLFTLNVEEDGSARHEHMHQRQGGSSAPTRESYPAQTGKFIGMLPSCEADVTVTFQGGIGGVVKADAPPTTQAKFSFGVVELCHYQKC